MRSSSKQTALSGFFFIPSLTISLFIWSFSGVVDFCSGWRVVRLLNFSLPPLFYLVLFSVLVPLWTIFCIIMAQNRPFQMAVGGGNSRQYNDTTYTKIFVGGLAWETQRDTMRRYFEQFGEILEAVVITDKNTGRSKGYGFVSPLFVLYSCFFPLQGAYSSIFPPTAWFVYDGGSSFLLLTGYIQGSGSSRESLSKPIASDWWKEGKLQSCVTWWTKESSTNSSTWFISLFSVITFPFLAKYLVEYFANLNKYPLSMQKLIIPWIFNQHCAAKQREERGQMPFCLPFQKHVKIPVF